MITVMIKTINQYQWQNKNNNNNKPIYKYNGENCLRKITLRYKLTLQLWVALKPIHNFVPKF